MIRNHEKQAKLAVIAYLRSADLLPPEVVLLNEFTANFSSVRADLVRIDRSGLHAIEIKSAADTFKRVASQLSGYARHFSTTTFAVAERHVDKAFSQLPSWTGIWSIEDSKVTCLRESTMRRVRKSCLIDMLPVSALAKLTDGNNLGSASRGRVDLAASVLQLSHSMLQQEVITFYRERHKPLYARFLENYGRCASVETLELLSPGHSKRTMRTAAIESRKAAWLELARLPALGDN